MKHEYKKHEKDLYQPKSPCLVQVPAMKYIALKGEGNPNSTAFAHKIEALYACAYTIKMFPRNGVNIPDYVDYTVYPLEGVWDLSLKGRQEESLNKDELIYTIMIRQPDFITDDIFKLAIEKSKHKNDEIKDIEFIQTEPTQCVHMMHNGPYDTEPESFRLMEEYCASQGLKRLSKCHREIYLSDFRKTKAESLKTILRVEV